ncbi:hypothetical protein CPB83DRAFT_905635 [Crepidotus variabilis]|uniref:CCAAT-binding factor domain-containing protein n=1 Tax=Crepidotus variabilis TaxID=179855 RepID=A0A9P6JS16_9AGAR|nr:hypothetical protein CPB83DRAFT_905635 [Crepidotus variabilis]
MARVRSDKAKISVKQVIRASKPPLGKEAGFTEDATLSQDVSKFLKELNIHENLSQTPSTNAKGKERVAGSKPTRPATEKGPKAKTTNNLKHTKKTDFKAKKASVHPPRPKLSPEVQNAPQVRTKLSSSSSRSKFIFQPISHWHAALSPLDLSTSPIAPDKLSTLVTHAAQLHEADIHAFQTSSSEANPASSEAGFLSKIIQAGTLSDRLSALTLLVQSSPVHNLKALETLKGMAERGKGKGGREESLKALRCIVDWWVGGGAPSRKLRYFRDQPLLHPEVTDEYILLWYFEDWLKKYFFSVLQVLETLSLDPLPYIRTQTISLIFTLIRDKPEQEQNLLRLLVNKLGDTEKSLCSRASYHLLQLLQAHPSMKAVVVKEIIALVMKPSSTSVVASESSLGDAKQNKHIRFADGPARSKTKAGDKDKDKKNGNPHAKYYATVTFNQIVLTPGDREVSLTLLDMYFEMFKEVLGDGNSGEEELPEGAEEQEEVAKTDKHGRVKEGRKAKGKGRDSGRNVVKGAAGFTEVEDSKSKLISAILTGVNRALPFAKIGADDTGIIKHIDTLFLITHTSTFNISLQALILIQQIVTSLSTSLSLSSVSSPNATVKSITDRYYRALYTSLHDIRLASSSKQAMYLNLFFKSIKADVGSVSEGKSNENVGVEEVRNMEKNERIKALIRRFTQVLVSGGSGATEFIAGGLYLLGELFGSIPGLREIINQPPLRKTELKEAKPYDPKKRDPQFAHASSSLLWELVGLILILSVSFTLIMVVVVQAPLLNHYHPTISLHARQILLSQPLTASADLSQNTLSHFLDRFVYKNPKKLKPNLSQEGEVSNMIGKGPSAMQPSASGVEGVKLIKGEIGYAGEDVLNEKAFLKRRRGDVPVDQLFFHDYFTKKAEKTKALAAKAKKRDSGEDESGDEDEDSGHEQPGIETKTLDDDWAEEDSDADEAEIWKAMKASMPKVDEDGDLMENSDDEDDEDDIVFDDDSDLVLSDGDTEDENNDAPDTQEDDGSNDDLSLVENSDNEDLLSLDHNVDIPEGLIEYDGSDASDDEDADEEWGGISSGHETAGKRKREDSGVSGKRKKLKSLPTFASYEDYAKLIDGAPEDEI